MGNQETIRKANVRIHKAVESNATELDLKRLLLEKIPEDVCKLSQLKQITSIDLSFNHITCSAVLDIVGNCPWLKELNLSYNYLGESLEALKAISEGLHKLEKLELNSYATHGPRMSEEGAVIISALPNLKSLSLMNNAVGTEGAKAIAFNISGLNYLNLFDNKIGSDGVTAIVQNLSNIVHLENLHIDGNPIGDEGVTTIIHGLKISNEFSLSSCGIGDEGAKIIAANLKHLHILNLSYNNIGNEGVIAIANELKSLRNLGIRNNNISDKGVIFILENLRNLERLNIAENNISQIRKNIMLEVFPDAYV